MNVVEKFNAITEIISDAKALLIQLQGECPHENYIASYGGSTGNWCEADDAYWVTIRCPDCGYTRSHSSKNGDGSRNEVYYSNHPRMECQ